MSNGGGSGKRSPTQRGRVRQRARRNGRLSQPLHGEVQRDGTASQQQSPEQQDENGLHASEVHDSVNLMAVRAPRLEEMRARIHDVHAGVCHHLIIHHVCFLLAILSDYIVDPK